MTQPLWQQPITVLTTVGGISLFAIPILLDINTPRVISALYIDVSLSDQEFSQELQKICHQRLDKLMSKDVRIDAKFADETMVLSNQNFAGKDKLNLQQDCKNILNVPAGVGNQKGTDVMSAIDSLNLELQKQQTQGNNSKTIAIFALNALEPKVNQSSVNLEELKAKMQPMIDKGSIILFVGPDLASQQKLKQTFSSVNNTDICSYVDSKKCIDWAFEQGRK